MDDSTRQLVEAIARQVIASLQEQGHVAQPASPPADPPTLRKVTPVHPPVGVCTGDYSKFSELAGSEVGAPPPSDESNASLANRTPPPLSGIITASQLQAALNASSDGTAVLVSDARLTPLANDLARRHPEKVRRVANVSAASGMTSATSPPWLWWIDGHCTAIQELIDVRGGGLRLIPAARHSAALFQVVRDVAIALKNGSVPGGLLFVQNVVRAMCFANRCPSIRAVAGTSDQAVEQGIAELGANVLVIEYPIHRPAAMEALMDRFMQQRPKPPPLLQRELTELQGIG